MPTVPTPQMMRARRLWNGSWSNVQDFGCTNPARCSSTVPGTVHQFDESGGGMHPINSVRFKVGAQLFFGKLRLTFEYLTSKIRPIQ